MVDVGLTVYYPSIIAGAEKPGLKGKGAQGCMAVVSMDPLIAK